MTDVSPDQPAVPNDSFYDLPRSLTRGVLRTVGEISRHLFECDTPASRRATFHILASSNSIPAYKSGGIWHLSIATLNARIWMMETEGWSEREKQLGRLYIALSGLQPRLKKVIDHQETSDETAAFLAEALKAIDRLLNY